MSTTDDGRKQTTFHERKETDNHTRDQQRIYTEKDSGGK
jgi:hypothetical protein